jgi:hypothetical protein
VQIEDPDLLGKLYACPECDTTLEPVKLKPLTVEEAAARIRKQYGKSLDVLAY